MKENAIFCVAEYWKNFENINHLTYPFVALVRKKTWKSLDIVDFLTQIEFRIVNLLALNIFVSKCQLFELFNIFVDCLTYGTYQSPSIFTMLSLIFTLVLKIFFGFSLYLPKCFLVFSQCILPKVDFAMIFFVDIFEIANGSLFSLQLEIIWSI